MDGCVVSSGQTLMEYRGSRSRIDDLGQGHAQVWTGRRKLLPDVQNTAGVAEEEGIS